MSKVKLLIEVDKELYKSVKNETYCGSLYRELRNGTVITDNICPVLSDDEVKQPCLQSPCPNARPKGEWIYKYSLGDSKYFVCSKCNRSIEIEDLQTLKDYPFCHCGAKMM